MSKETGGPAFPHGVQIGEISKLEGGLTIRDYFASQAMAGLMSSYTSAIGTEEGLERIMPVICYRMADAMINERNK